jgi:EmrB/QacA subfamily drug resistance transporter
VPAVASTVDGTTRAPDPATPGDRYQWAALAVVLVGSLMVVLDTTIVNVALPEIGAGLHAGEGIEWVVTSYLLGVVVAQPATAWMADRFGRKPVFLASLASFTLASCLCALAPNLVVLVAFRALQGLGGGAMIPVGMAIVFEVFPPDQRGQAVGIWGISSMAGPAIGPTLGGWLVTNVGWHWLFLINVPVGAIGFGLGVRLLRDTGHRAERRLDVVGLLTGAGGLALAVLGVSESPRWGWGSPSTLGCVVVGVALLLVFARHELRTPDPVVELRIFRTGVFAAAMGLIFFTAAAQFTRLVFVPLELAALRDYTALRIGLLLIPQAVATAVGMPLGGRLLDRIGARTPAVVGLMCMIAATATLGLVRLGTPVGVIVGALCLQGFGMGLTTAPATVSALNALPDRFVAQVSAVRSLNTQVAGAVAIAALSALVAARMGADPSPAREQAAYDTAFLAASAGLCVALVLALRLPRRPGEGRAAEHTARADIGPVVVEA